MWSSVLRSIMQGYFLSTYSQLELWNVQKFHTSQNLIQIYFSIFLAFTFPILVTKILMKNKNKLEDKSFFTKYGSLYENLRRTKTADKNNMYWVTIFLFKRLMLALITIWSPNFAWL